ncbi:MAG: DUF1552 domain-containing protein [Isosphaeraceae bacterium]
MKSDHPLDATALLAQRHASLSRRHFLKGVGVTMALPAFDSLLARGAGAAPASSAALSATSPTGAPIRMAFVYVPNGVNLSNWWPKKEGKDFDLNRTMQPLERVKSQIQVISGLDQINATGGKDGPGDHARACATFLTGVRAKKTAGADIHAGISIDQVAAQRIGHLTRFPSLELACDAARKSGNCDSGYSCAYQFNLSWSSPSLPLAPEPNPRFAFERLFGAGPSGERTRNLLLRQEQQRSILDFVLDDTRALQGELGYRDQQKLDEYLTSVREIERRIQAAEKFRDIPNPAEATPAGIPASFLEHVQLMYDLMFLAFQTDSTRVATFLLAYESSNRTFPDIGITDGHHNLSHHQNKKENLEKIAAIDLWYMTQFARFLERLEDAKDADGTSILHNSMIVYGSGNGDGNRHNHNNLPFLMAGRGGGNLSPGKYLKLKPQPMSNLFLGMLDRVGIHDVARHGDSTGRIEAI